MASTASTPSKMTAEKMSAASMETTSSCEKTACMQDSTVSSNKMTEEKPSMKETIGKLPTNWTLNERQLCEVEMILSGAFHPLQGFMCKKDYTSVVENMRLASGEVWPLPICLPIPKGTVDSNVHWMEKDSEDDKEEEQKVIRLRNDLGIVIGELHVEDVYEVDMTNEMTKVYGTADSNHPYVSYMQKTMKDCYYVGGRIVGRNPIEYYDFENYRLSPKEVKEKLHCIHYNYVKEMMENQDKTKETEICNDKENEKKGEKGDIKMIEKDMPTISKDIDQKKSCSTEEQEKKKRKSQESDCDVSDLQMENPFQEKKKSKQSQETYDDSSVLEMMKNVKMNFVGFQTRNPLHRSHFELTVKCVEKVSQNKTESEGKTMEEKMDHQKTVLLLTPAVGPTQPGDIDYPLRVRCYENILPEYTKRGIHNTQLVLLPLPMRMAGPREAVWHAIIRKNYGCTHFIVGRDHAGPSTRKADGSPFYGPYDAQKMLEEVAADIGISPVFGAEMVFVNDEKEGEISRITTANSQKDEAEITHRECKGHYMEITDVPKDTKTLSLSGSELRRRLQEREMIPSWFSFPHVVDELQKFYKPLHQKGLVIYFTGLPCSGKSSLALALKSMIESGRDENRSITVLDADIIRTHLSKGLGFSREDRSTNVRRIGYIASEIGHHGGICLVANIAPYEEDRSYNKHLIESQGGLYIEVYVSTPLDVCEKRDVKELYKKARKGIIKQFTGVSDPYEIPNKPNLVIDSSEQLKDKAQEVYTFLKNKKFLI